MGEVLRHYYAVFKPSAAYRAAKLDQASPAFHTPAPTTGGGDNHFPAGRPAGGLNMSAAVIVLLDCFVLLDQHRKLGVSEKSRQARGDDGDDGSDGGRDRANRPAVREWLDSPSRRNSSSSNGVTRRARVAVARHKLIRIGPLDLCNLLFDHLPLRKEPPPRALGPLRRRRDRWGCAWCGGDEARDRRPGPDGPATLCNSCGGSR